MVHKSNFMIIVQELYRGYQLKAPMIWTMKYPNTAETPNLSMACSRLADPEYQCWLKVGLGLMKLKEFMAPHTEHVMRAFHARIIFGVAGRPPCNCTYINIDRVRMRMYPPCPTCDSIIQEIIQAYREISNFRMLNFRNINPSKWSSDFWELAKCFMGRGFQVTNRGIMDTDINSILILWNNCNEFDPLIGNRQLLHSVMSTCNATMHAPNMTCSQLEMMSRFGTMINFLEDPKFSAAPFMDPQAVTSMETIRDASIELSDLINSDLETLRLLFGRHFGEIVSQGYRSVSSSDSGIGTLTDDSYSSVESLSSCDMLWESEMDNYERDNERQKQSTAAHSYDMSNAIRTAAYDLSEITSSQLHGTTNVAMVHPGKESSHETDCVATEDKAHSSNNMEGHPGPNMVTFHNRVIENRRFAAINVGHDGGSLSLMDTTVVIPFGAVSEDKQQHIVLGCSTAFEDLPLISANQRIVTSVIHCLPHATQFEEYVVIRIGLDGTLRGDENPNNMKVMYSPTNLGQNDNWKVLPTTGAQSEEIAIAMMTVTDIYLRVKRFCKYCCVMDVSPGEELPVPFFSKIFIFARGVGPPLIQYAMVKVTVVFTDKEKEAQDEAGKLGYGRQVAAHQFELKCLSEPISMSVMRTCSEWELQSLSDDAQSIHPQTISKTPQPCIVLVFRHIATSTGCVTPLHYSLSFQQGASKKVVEVFNFPSEINVASSSQVTFEPAVPYPTSETSTPSRILPEGTQQHSHTIGTWNQEDNETTAAREPSKFVTTQHSPNSLGDIEQTTVISSALHQYIPGGMANTVPHVSINHNHGSQQLKPQNRARQWNVPPEHSGIVVDTETSIQVINAHQRKCRFPNAIYGVKRKFKGPVKNKNKNKNRNKNKNKNKKAKQPMELNNLSIRHEALEVDTSKRNSVSSDNPRSQESLAEDEDDGRMRTLHLEDRIPPETRRNTEINPPLLVQPQLPQQHVPLTLPDDAGAGDSLPLVPYQLLGATQTSNALGSLTKSDTQTRIYVQHNTLYMQSNQTAMTAQILEEMHNERPLLPCKVRVIICTGLDGTRVDYKDWRQLSEKLKFSSINGTLTNSRSPTADLLTLWESRREPFEDLMEVLREIGRSDIAESAEESLRQG